MILASIFAFRWYARSRMRSVGIAPTVTSPPGVVTGEGFLSTGVFAEGLDVGSVTDIAIGEFDPSPGTEVGIAGQRGAAFLDEAAGVKSSVQFGNAGVRVDIIDVEGDGVCEFMECGLWRVPASVIDHQGTTLWTYGEGGAGVADMAAGDIDGDGALEFVVGSDADGGVHLLESDGTLVWQQPDDDVWHVEFVDTDGDGSLEIVHTNAAGQMTVRDLLGKVIRQGTPAGYYPRFSLCRWPVDGPVPLPLIADDGTLGIYDYGSKTVAQFDAPQCGLLGEARGTPVRLRAGQSPHLAVLVDFRGRSQAVLYVYDSEGGLVYREIVPESCPSIAVLPLPDGQTEALLVGANDRVLRYDFAEAD